MDILVDFVRVDFIKIDLIVVDFMKVDIVRVDHVGVDLTKVDLVCTPQHEAAKPQKASPRGKYNDYTPQKRAWIGKHLTPITVQ